jgi:leucine dehydrogenase
MSIKEISKNFNIYRLPEYDDHHKVYWLENEAYGLQGVIAIHRNLNNMPAIGVTRFRQYDSPAKAIWDALRLSRMMSYISVLAGLPYGGAEGIIIDSSSKNKKAILNAYIKTINRLDGQFLSGSDLGLAPQDVKTMQSKSKYIFNPKASQAYFAAIGVFYAIEESLNQVYGSETIAGRHFAIQGLGHLGQELVKLLVKHGGQVAIADTDEKKVKQTLKTYPEVKPVDPAEIQWLPVDVFCPCAIGEVITADNANKLNCRIVAGGAHSQLASRDVGQILYDNNILYAPDYIASSGGLIGVTDQYQNPKNTIAQTLARVKSIKQNLRQIYKTSEKTKLAPNIVGDKIAEKLIRSN